jgi:hypothetical protein
VWRERLVVVVGWAMLAAAACGRGRHPGAGDGSDAAPASPDGGGGAGLDGGVEERADGTAEPADGIAGDRDLGAEDRGSDGDGDETGGVAPPCDDGNPCTIDRRDNGGCAHVPVDDGHPCEDGNLCSLGDRCQAGACVPGPAPVGPPEVLARLSGFAGGALAVGDGRFLFYDSPGGITDGTRLILGRIDDAGFAVLDTVEDFFADSVNAQIAVTAIGGGLAAFANRYAGTISLVDTAGDRLRARGNLQLGDGTAVVAAIASGGTRLWACDNDAFLGSANLALFDVSDLDAPAELGVLPLDAPCASLAVSPDGNRVYLGDPSGLHRLDATGVARAEDLVVGDVIAPPSLVLAVEPLLVLGQPAVVRLLRESDLVETASLAIPGLARAAAAGSILFAEGIRAGAGAAASGEAFVSIFDIGAGPPPALLDEVVVGAGTPVTAGVPGSSIADAGHVILGSSRRAFAVAAGGRLQEVDIPQVGDFSFVAGAGAEAHVIDALRFHRIVLDDPAHPTMTAVSHDLPSYNDLVLDEGATVPHLFLGVTGRAPLGRVFTDSPLLTGGARTPTVQRWTLVPPASIQVSGTFQLPDETVAQLFVAGDYLYRLAAPTAGAGPRIPRLQRWALDALPTSGAAVPAPEADLAFDPCDSPGVNFPPASFDVDPRARRAVVVVCGLAGAGAIYWIDLSTSPPTVEEKTPAPDGAGAIRLVGDRAVLEVGGSLAYLVSRQEVGRLGDSRPGTLYVIEFDGQVIYARSRETPTGAYSLAVVPFAGAEPDVTRFPLSGPATSLAATDTALVIGSPGELVMLRPPCAR